MVPVGATVSWQALRCGRHARELLPAALPREEGAALDGEALGLGAGLVCDELHDGAADLDALLGVVGNAEADEHVGEAHDAEAGLAGEQVHALDLGDRVVVGVDGVVEEVGGRPHGGTEQVPVDLGAVGAE